jgi:hypothetical protein
MAPAARAMKGCESSHADDSRAGVARRFRVRRVRHRHRRRRCVVLTRFLTTLLFGVKTTDAATLIGAVGLLTVAALLATYRPVRRAVQSTP